MPSLFHVRPIQIEKMWQVYVFSMFSFACSGRMSYHLRMACDSKGCMPFLISSVILGVSHEDNLAVGGLCTIVLFFLGNFL